VLHQVGGRAEQPHDDLRQVQVVRQVEERLLVAPTGQAALGNASRTLDACRCVESDADQLLQPISVDSGVFRERRHRAGDHDSQNGKEADRDQERDQNGHASRQHKAVRAA